MRKLREISTKGGASARGLIEALVPLVIVATGFWFWTATAAFAQDKRSGGDDESTSQVGGETKNKNKGKNTNKCTVCHNPHNFHPISIPCNQVDKFLRNHPGDFAGPCTVTPHTSR
jgi:hypothetical protein